MQRYLPVDSIVAFEPMRANVRLLETNIARGPRPDRVRVYPVALSDRTERELLQVDDMTDGSSRLDRLAPGQSTGGRLLSGQRGRTAWVESVTLDEIVERDQLPAATVIKIDVEGAEALVLQGARRTLRRDQPDLVISLHDDQAAAKSLLLLDELGYHCCSYVRDRTGQVHYARLTSANLNSLVSNNTVASTVLSRVAEPPEDLDFDRLTWNL
mgnify:CR=1 FL=1